jgi:predicted amidohydrolase
MKTTVRFGGAQIPVTPYVQTNLLAIRRAIDWAAENNVDYLVTPEASLSGYTSDFDNALNRIVESLQEVEEYAALKNVGLCLGTVWDEAEYSGQVRRNQIRFYNNTGNFCGTVNKYYCIEDDVKLGISSDNRTGLIPLPVADKVIPAGGLICVDMYGVEGGHSLVWQLKGMGAKIILHSTNGVRNIEPTNGLSKELSNKISNDWNDINLRRASFLTRCPILTVDNCYMADGTEYYGNTSSESGVLVDGEWVTKVPRTGTQYFYYDFKVDDIAIDWPNQENIIE